jgi:hypothetical protein
MENPTDQLVVIDSEPGAFTFFSWKNMSVIVWTGQVTLAGVERLERISELMRKRFPGGVSATHIVCGDTKLPHTETRMALARQSKEYGGWLKAVAVVIGGSGFWASTMRSVVTAIGMLGSRAYEMRIHGSIEDVVQWLPAVHLKRTGVRVEPEQLLSILRRTESGDPLAADPVVS